MNTAPPVTRDPRRSVYITSVGTRPWQFLESGASENAQPTRPSPCSFQKGSLLSTTIASRSYLLALVSVTIVSNAARVAVP
jgi:hypothetical protein